MNAPAPLSRSVDDTLVEPILRTEDLFEGNRRLTILHSGQVYTLRITRQGKLLLTK